MLHSNRSMYFDLNALVTIAETKNKLSDEDGIIYYVTYGTFFHW